MPVIAVSENWIAQLLANTKLTNKTLIDQKTIYYRPWYGLPNYETTYDYWAKSISPSGQLKRDGPYDIPWPESGIDRGKSLDILCWTRLNLPKL